MRLTPFLKDGVDVFSTFFVLSRKKDYNFIPAQCGDSNRLINNPGQCALDSPSFSDKIIRKKDKVDGQLNFKHKNGLTFRHQSALSQKITASFSVWRWKLLHNPHMWFSHHLSIAAHHQIEKSSELSRKTAKNGVILTFAALNFFIPFINHRISRRKGVAMSVSYNASRSDEKGTTVCVKNEKRVKRKLFHCVIFRFEMKFVGRVVFSCLNSNSQRNRNQPSGSSRSTALEKAMDFSVPRALPGSRMCHSRRWRIFIKSLPSANFFKFKRRGTVQHCSVSFSSHTGQLTAVGFKLSENETLLDVNGTAIGVRVGKSFEAPYFYTLCRFISRSTAFPILFVGMWLVSMVTGKDFSPKKFFKYDVDATKVSWSQRKKKTIHPWSSQFLSEQNNKSIKQTLLYYPLVLYYIVVLYC